ncbi:MAG: DUF4199 domain-containing protein [Saprospirales bacterium]|nr:MAG: DUF4199 domain-containing protein [Saprospirales bacterium]
MENKVSTFNTATRYGLFAGLILIVWSLITMVLFDRSSFIASFLGILVTTAVTIGLSVMVINFHRDKELGGYISFSKAFVVSILAILIAGAVSSVFSIVDRVIISPEFYESAKDEMALMYEDMGMDDEAIDMAIRMVEVVQSPIGIFFTGVLIFAFFGAIISLITALILKNEEPTPDF